MRHKKVKHSFGRQQGHRKAMLSNVVKSLIQHEKIVTTVRKAKEARKIIEPLITLAKKDTVHNKRLAFSVLNNRLIVSKLFNVLGPRFLNRPGGYTRVLKNGHRIGDASPMALMLFSDYTVDPE